MRTPMWSGYRSSTVSITSKPEGATAAPPHFIGEGWAAGCPAVRPVHPATTSQATSPNDRIDRTITGATPGSDGSADRSHSDPPPGRVPHTGPQDSERDRAGSWLGSPTTAR